MLKVVAKSAVKKDCLENVLALYGELVKKTREEQGCLSYELFQDTENPYILTMIETWESREYLEKHFQSAHFTALVPKIKECREGSAELNIYTQIL